MADASIHSRLLNPWVLHHQKLGLELKCPLCLSLLHRPLLLPCNHIFCDSCVPRSTQFGSDCPLCKEQYTDKDVRSAPYMENLVTIYRNLDATLSSGFIQPLTPVSAPCGRVHQESPISSITKAVDEMKDLVETLQERNSSSSQSLSPQNNSTKDGDYLAARCYSSSTQNPTKALDNGMVFEGGNNLIPPQNAKLEADEIKLKSSESSPISPPCLDTKGLFDESSDPGSAMASTEKLPVKRSLACAGDDHVRDFKRQKKLNYGLDKILAINGCPQADVYQSKRVEAEETLGEKVLAVSDPSSSNKSACAFCQSSQIKDSTGEMLHYLNGKEVNGDAELNSSIIHVHKTCIEWTPQVYFVGEAVENLKAEVARASKLKCSSCGLKGAALGCFMKSCRKTYHVPCAVETSDCKWDSDDFLMLCPSHSYVKFPREKKSKQLEKKSSQKQHFVPTQIAPKQFGFWGDSADGAKQWVFCGSALSSEEKYLLVKFAKMCDARVVKFWDPSVTHVIAATDESGACSRTLKVLMAILHGRWILKTNWVKACMEAMHPVDEEVYEVTLDNHGCRDGPKTGRLRALDNVPKLFNDLSFFFSGDFIPGFKENLLDLVTTAGGTIILSKEELVSQTRVSQETSLKTLVVYNKDSTLCTGRTFIEQSSEVQQRVEVAERLAVEVGTDVVAHTWLLESIAASKLQSFCCS